MTTSSKLRKLFPWITEPLIVSAPMRPYAKHELATEVTLAGGLGFLPNCNETAQTRKELNYAAEKFAKSSDQGIKALLKNGLPIGLGYQIYQESLDEAVSVIKDFRPAAVWLFAARKNEDYGSWAKAIREVHSDASLWIQVGTIAEALEAIKHCGENIVLVMQGSDAGGHGLQHSAGLVTLLPEAVDTLRQYNMPILAAGGISEGRGAAAALLLGAEGIVLGTRLLASSEAHTPKGFVQHILDTNDGGSQTRRTRLFDNLRGTGDFPAEYDGRALINQSIREDDKGLPEAEAIEKYKAALRNPDTAFGDTGRLVSYAGTGVGLVKDVKPAGEIIREVRDGALSTIKEVHQKASRWQ